MFYIFSRLSRLALALLCVPASSTTSERVFSDAGRILEARRQQLSRESVDSLIFLRKLVKWSSLLLISFVSFSESILFPISFTCHIMCLKYFYVYDLYINDLFIRDFVYLFVCLWSDTFMILRDLVSLWFDPFVCLYIYGFIIQIMSIWKKINENWHDFEKTLI